MSAGPVVSLTSAAVAASRARLLAALGADGGDDVAPTAAPQAAAAAPAAASAANMRSALPAPAAGVRQVAAAATQPATACPAADAPAAGSKSAVHQLAPPGVSLYLQAGAGAGHSMLLPVMQLGPLGMLAHATVPGITQAAVLQRLIAQQQLHQCLQRQHLMGVAVYSAGASTSAAGAFHPTAAVAATGSQAE
ncbi:hypothetical protein COO60DRAFT_520363 [Scenedesmus sp. NREL 46B-D3]|nr:hypothetical protein COO60DRAFT_520363 [Scenedesmus sp. NREL 46B-D3]